MFNQRRLPTYFAKAQSLRLSLVSAFLVVFTDARSWDIAVALGQQIDFFVQNGTQVERSRVPDAKMLTGLAYDSGTRTMYMSDRKNENISMYGSNLTEIKSDPYTMLNQTNGVKIMAMVFDPVDRTLYWTDGKNHTVMKMKVPLNGNPKPNHPEVLHELKDYNPYGIALDICNRFIYWSICKEPTVCSIERSKLEVGSEREVVVNSTLYDVYGLAVDHDAGKLYWVDDLEGNSYKIERSNLDGKERALFLKGTHHEPIYIAVDNEAVYWTDKQSEAVWKMKKTKRTGDKPIEFKSYSASNPHSRIMSIITRDNIGDIDCDAVLKAQRDRLENLVCNHREGSTGAFCEVSVCHNYCLHGNCVRDAEGLPECVCGISYTGNRCEKDVCDGWCLNNGICSVSGAGPSCKCENSKGSRCEYTTKLDELCSPYCK